MIDTISGKEDSSNKVTSLSNSSTDTQYPSAKCVYDNVKDKVDGDGISHIVKITQTDYDLLPSVDSTTLYVIIPSSNN